MYKVISGLSLYRLESEVQRMLSDGWTLIGGVSVVYYPGGKLEYFQAMYKNEFV